ncbi:hypothetical protein F4678DRAFT_472144 [Xylaria arbuscula]|nr:hypothetical protein F4678DRAFT_472144 [Xylaria arbuscula]
MGTQSTQEDIARVLPGENDTLVPNIYACSIVTSVASAAVILFRLWARRLAHGGIFLDISDWLLVAAWVFFIAALASFSLAARYGLGRHFMFITNVRLFYIWSVLLEVFYYLCIGSIKLSILSFYGTIFTVKQFRPYLWTMALIVIAWCIASVVVSIAQCLPFQFGWDKTISGGVCINYGLLVLSAGIINVITDFIILCLPIPLILRLHISSQKKYLLIFTFASGSSACIVSIVRLAFSLVVSSTSDPSWNNVDTGFVSAVELLVGILAASIPTYRPLYRRYIQRSTTLYPKQNSNFPSQGQVSARSHNANKSAKNRAPVSGPGVHITDEVELTRHTFREGNWIITRGTQHRL